MGLFDIMNIKDFDVHLSTPIIQPGQMLTGNVVFTIKSEMPFRKFTIKIIGREKTHVVTQHGDDVRHYHDTRNFFKVHITALGMPKWGGTNWQGTLAPGNYNFPIAVRLPIDILPSMIHNVGANTASAATVQYYVKAKFDVPFSTDSDKKVGFTVVTPKPVMQALSAPPFVSLPTKVARSSCCCCDRGCATVNFGIEKNVVIFGQDDVLNGQITVNNFESKEPLRKVVVNLVHQTSFSASGHSCVAVSTMTPAVMTSIVANVQAFDKEDRTFSFKLPIGRPLCSDKKTPVPCSFAGSLMTNRYFLSFLSDWDELGMIPLMCASAVDTNAVLPVQTDTVKGQTVPKAMYPRFLYAPPPGGIPQVPPQKADIGPFACQPPLELFPY